MPDYWLRGARRAEDGSIGDVLIDEAVTAPNRREAINLANARDWSEDNEAVNALWLVDEAGNLLWSLRLADTRG